MSICRGTRHCTCDTRVLAGSRPGDCWSPLHWTTRQHCLLQCNGYGQIIGPCSSENATHTQLSDTQNAQGASSWQTTDSCEGTSHLGVQHSSQFQENWPALWKTISQQGPSSHTHMYPKGPSILASSLRPPASSCLCNRQKCSRESEHQTPRRKQGTEEKLPKTFKYEQSGPTCSISITGPRQAGLDFPHLSVDLVSFPVLYTAEV